MMPRILRILPARFLTLTALLAVLVAADPRINHLAHCRRDCSTSAATSPSAVEPPRGCCSNSPAPRPAPSPDPCGGCECCHLADGRPAEREARPTFVAPAPLKADFVAPIATFTTFAIAPQTPVGPPLAFVATGPGSPLGLLCNHLRT